MVGFNYGIDPATGDYTMDAGQFVRDDTALTPIALALLDDRGWWGDSGIGSIIRELLRGLPPADPPEALRAATLQALAPLLSLGRISSLQVEVAAEVPYTVRVQAIDGGTGNPITMTVTP